MGFDGPQVSDVILHRFYYPLGVIFPTILLPIGVNENVVCRLIYNNFDQEVNRLGPIQCFSFLFYAD